MLHKFVWEVERLPTTEYFNWIAYIDTKAQTSKGDSGNLLEMSSEDLVRAVT